MVAGAGRFRRRAMPAAALVALALAGPAAPRPPAPLDAKAAAAAGSVRLTRDGLAVGGPIGTSTAPRFAAALAVALLLDGDGRTRLELDSGGGNLAVALGLARLVRLAGRLTAVEAWVGAGASCQSACAVLFAAATRRLAAPTAVFMFHAPRFDGAAPDPLAAGRVAAAAEARYLEALARADQDLVRRLKAAGAFDAPEATFLSAADLAGGDRRFVSELRAEPVPGG